MFGFIGNPLQRCAAKTLAFLGILALALPAAAQTPPAKNASAYITLTLPSGHQAHVRTCEVNIITGAIEGMADKRAKTVVTVHEGRIYVRDKVEEIIAKVDEAGHCADYTQLTLPNGAPIHVRTCDIHQITPSFDGHKKARTMVTAHEIKIWVLETPDEVRDKANVDIKCGD